MKKDNFDEAMDSMKKMTGDNSIKKIGLNDTFGFKCQQCGQCCMFREDIILNPYDIYNAAKYLNITTEEFILKYTISKLGGNSKIPMILLKTERNGFCPFLKLDVKAGGKFKCTIHDAKPGACANHPIGVARGKNLETGETDVSYIICKQCDNSVSDEQQLVKNWVQKYIDHEEEIAIAHELQTKVTDYFSPKEFYEYVQALVLYETFDAHNNEEDEDEPSKKLGAEVFMTYLTTTVSLAYAEYDTNKPFIPQAKENLKELSKFYESTVEIFNKLKTFAEMIEDKAKEYFGIEDEEGEDEDAND